MLSGVDLRAFRQLLHERGFAIDTNRDLAMADGTVDGNREVAFLASREVGRAYGQLHSDSRSVNSFTGFQRTVNLRQCTSEQTAPVSRQSPFSKLSKEPSCFSPQRDWCRWFTRTRRTGPKKSFSSFT